MKHILDDKPWTKSPVLPSKPQNSKLGTNMSKHILTKH